MHHGQGQCSDHSAHCLHAERRRKIVHGQDSGRRDFEGWSVECGVGSDQNSQQHGRHGCRIWARGVQVGVTAARASSTAFKWPTWLL